jgi:hypothetical protein
MKEYIVRVEDDDNNFDEVFIAHIRNNPELIRCDDCKYYSTCLIRVSLPVENDYCGNAKRDESEE